MRKINETNTISSFLNSTIFSDIKKEAKFGFVVKQSTIFSFWNNIVGAKFANYTKPYAIRYSKLYVSAKSPVIVQELSLYKNKILKNINTYSKPLGIEIKDIVFNYKNFSAQNPIESALIEDKPEKISENQLKNVEIESELKESIEKHVQKINFLNENQKKEFSEKIISTYKAKIIQNSSKKD